MRLIVPRDGRKPKGSASEVPALMRNISSYDHLPSDQGLFGFKFIYRILRHLWGIFYGVKPYFGVFNEWRFSVPRADHPFRAQDPLENNGGESTKKTAGVKKRAAHVV